MKKSDEKRQLILETAYRLFSANGFEKTSMSEVTAQVGGSKATIYNYFPSKEELFVECMFGVAEGYLEGIFSHLHNPTAALAKALQRFGEDVLRLVCSPDMVAAQRLMIAEAGRSGIGRMFYEKIMSRQEQVAEFMAAAMSAGKLRKATPMLAAMQFRALLEAEILEPLLLCVDDEVPGERAIKQAATHAVDAFMRAYAP